MPKNLKISVFYSVIQNLGWTHVFEVKQNRLSILLSGNVQEEQSSRHHIQIHKHSSKKGKNQELELMSFLNRRLLCLTWLLPNLNGESQKVHGLYMLLAVAVGSLMPGCMTPKSGVSRKNYSLPLNCSLFPLLWCLSSMAALHRSQHIWEKKTDFTKPVNL